MRRIVIGICQWLVYLWIAGMLAGVGGLLLAWAVYVFAGNSIGGALVGLVALAWGATLCLFAVCVLPPLLTGWWLEDTAAQ